MRDSTFTAKAPRTPRNAKEFRLVAAILLVNLRALYVYVLSQAPPLRSITQAAIIPLANDVWVCYFLTCICTAPFRKERRQLLRRNIHEVRHTRGTFVGAGSESLLSTLPQYF
jgi:hypothetical protein